MKHNEVFSCDTLVTYLGGDLSSPSPKNNYLHCVIQERRAVISIDDGSLEETLVQQFNSELLISGAVRVEFFAKDFFGRTVWFRKLILINLCTHAYTLGPPMQMLVPHLLHGSNQ